MADTWLDVLTDALMEIGAYAPGDPISSPDMDLATRRGNRIIDAWAARKVYAFNVSFPVFTLIPNRDPHTIGPGGDVNITTRPVRLEGAALILNNLAVPVDLPLNLRDDDWWLNQRVKSLPSSVPTDVYYSPDFPSGSLHFWPVPNFAYGARLEIWVPLAGIPLDTDGVPDLTQNFSAPQGYSLAFGLTLAEHLCTPMGRPLTADLTQRAARARADLQKNNFKAPRIQTADFGTGRRASGFNYYAGQ